MFAYPKHKHHLVISLLTIILFQFVTVLLFVLSKKILNVNGTFFSVLHLFLQHSTLLIPLMMMVSFGLFIGCTSILINNNNVLMRYWFSFAILVSLLFLSIVPVGNYIKHDTLFFEHWMWLCAIWWHHLWIAVLLFWIWVRNPIARDGWISRNLHQLFLFFSCTHKHFYDSYFLMTAVTWTIVLSFFLGDFVLGGIPHVQDSIAQLFQAKVFSLGAFSLPVPHHAESFERIYTVMKDGRWYSIYPPGHAMILSLGVWMNAVHWVNPVISGITVLFTFSISKKIFGLPTARFTLLFMMISPFFMFMAAGYMNHPTALFFAVLFWYCLICSGEKTGWISLSWFMVAGISYGMLFLTRPLTALAFLVFGGLWIALTQKNNVKDITLGIIAFGIGTLPLAMFYFSYNQGTTGSPLLTGYVDYFGGNPLGFGRQPWGAEPLGPKIPNEVLHTPLRGFANTLCNINGLNYFLFGFPLPSLLFAALLFLPKMKRLREDWLCLFPLIGISTVHFFYFFQDFCFGPRFLYETLPFLCMLSARGIVLLPDWIVQHFQVQRANAVSGVMGIVMICVLGTFCVVWTERALSMSDNYWSTQDGTLDLAREVIKEEQVLIFTELDEDFAAFFSLMDPRLDRGWIVAHDLGESKNQEVIASYPNVPVYHVHLEENPSASGFITVVKPYTRSVIEP